MADCSEYAEVIYNLAKLHASQPGVDTIDAVLTRFRDNGVELERSQLVNAIVEASAARARDISIAQKQAAALRREARTDARLTKAIAELEQHLKEGTLPAPGAKRSPNTTEAIKSLQQKKAELRAALRESEPAIRARLQGQINRFLERLERNEYAIPMKEAQLLQSNEVTKLMYERDRLRRQIDQKIRDAQPKTFARRTLEKLGIIKLLQTTGDLMPVLRQGLQITASHPIKAAKVFVDGMRAFSDPVKAFTLQKSIEERSNYPQYIRAGLRIRELDGDLSNTAEDFAMPFLQRASETKAGKLTVEQARRALRAVQRGFTVYTNLLRAEAFDVFENTLAMRGHFSPAEAKQIARAVNIMSGEGDLGKFESVANDLNHGIFSARYWVSRLQSIAQGVASLSGEALSLPAVKMNGKEYRLLDADPVRRAIAKEYARQIIGMTAFALMTQAALGNDDESMWDILDPRSSRFFRPKIGNTVLDLSAGMGQTITLAARMISGETKTAAGEIIPIRGEDAKAFSDDAADLALGYGRKKAAPVPGAVLNLASGKDAVGNEVTLWSEVGNFVTPMSPRDVYEAITDEGTDSATAKALTSFMILIGAGSYREERGRSKSKQKRPRISWDYNRLP